MSTWTSTRGHKKVADREMVGEKMRKKTNEKIPKIPAFHFALFSFVLRRRERIPTANAYYVAQHSSRLLLYIISFNPCNNPLKQEFISHFVNEKTKTQVTNKLRDQNSKHIFFFF